MYRMLYFQSVEILLSSILIFLCKASGKSGVQSALWIRCIAIISSVIVFALHVSLQRVIRHSQSLCAGEQQYVHQRKQVVLESLNSLGINCTAVRKTSHASHKYASVYERGRADVKAAWFPQHWRRGREKLFLLNEKHLSHQNTVPHIALLASGGGQRAAVGLVGSVYQMEKEGLLDAMLYLGGVSGSTWWEQTLSHM